MRKTVKNIREIIKDKQRSVVKIGSSSLQHAQTGDLDYIRLEKLVRELCDIRNQGKEVILVTSGAIAAGKKILPIGTTSLRTLETVGDPNHKSVKAGTGVSDIYIYPPYTLRTADCLFTNFHTPTSSLAVLVSALIGVDELLRVYKYAVDQEYRFFSYGDAMLIL